MAAAKNKKHSSQNRRGTFTADALRKSASSLEGIAAAIRASAQTMQDSEISEVNIDGATKLDRGVDLMTQFIANIDREITRSRLKF
jgi:hypothetical protein